jgi:hypothetical protein
MMRSLTDFQQEAARIRRDRKRAAARSLIRAADRKAVNQGPLMPHEIDTWGPLGKRIEATIEAVAEELRLAHEAEIDALHERCDEVEGMANDLQRAAELMVKTSQRKRFLAARWLKDAIDAWRDADSMDRIFSLR